MGQIKVKVPGRHPGLQEGLIPFCSPSMLYDQWPPTFSPSSRSCERMSPADRNRRIRLSCFVDRVRKHISYFHCSSVCSSVCVCVCVCVCLSVCLSLRLLLLTVAETPVVPVPLIDVTGRIRDRRTVRQKEWPRVTGSQPCYYSFMFAADHHDSLICNNKRPQFTSPRQVFSYLKLRLRPETCQNSTRSKCPNLSALRRLGLCRVLEPLASSCSYKNGQLCF